MFSYCIIIVFKEKEIVKKQINPITHTSGTEFDKRQKRAIIVGLKYSLNNYYVKETQREKG